MEERDEYGRVGGGMLPDARNGCPLLRVSALIHGETIRYALPVGSGVAVPGRTGRLPPVQGHLPVRSRNSDVVIHSFPGRRCTQAESGIMTDLVDPAMSVNSNMLRQIVLPSEGARAFRAFEWSLLRMGPHVPFQVLEPLEGALAKLVCADKDFLALLEIGAIGRCRLVTLTLDTGQRTSFTLVATCCISSVPADRRFRNGLERFNSPETLRSAGWDMRGDIVPPRSSECDRCKGVPPRAALSSTTEGDVPWRDLTRRFLYAGLPSKRVR